jgi:Nucleoporin autopeptidase
VQKIRRILNFDLISGCGIFKPHSCYVNSELTFSHSLQFVHVYSDDHVPPGTGLNVPAEITLENIFPTPQVDSIINLLKSITNTNFRFYTADSGIWVFHVDHFSSYGLDSGYSSQIDYYRPFRRQASAVSQLSTPSTDTIGPTPTASSPRATPTSIRATSQRSERIAGMSSGPTSTSGATSMSRIDSSSSEVISDISTPSIESLAETDKHQLVSARRLFRKLAKEYLEQRKPPSSEELINLWHYDDIIDIKTFIKW